MSALAIGLFAVTTILYLSATVHYAIEFARGAGAISRWDVTERALTLVVHAGYLVALGYLYRELPFVGVNFLSLLALSLAVVQTLLEQRFRTRETGAFVFGVAFVLHLTSWPALTLRPELSEALRNPMFGAHIVAALLGYVGFLLSALYGVLYLFLYRLLKRKRFGLFFKRMPALDMLAGMNAHAALVGFICMTGALAFGVEMARQLEIEYLGDPKFIQSLAAWALYGLLLAGRYGLKWRGRPYVVASIVCFALMAVSAAVVVMAPSFHDFG